MNRMNETFLPTNTNISIMTDLFINLNTWTRILRFFAAHLYFIQITFIEQKKERKKFT